MPIPAFDPPTWATTSPVPAAATVPSQLRADGYSDFDLPTAVQVNRMGYEIGQWLTYLRTAAGGYTTLEDLVAGVEEGDASVLNEGNLDKAPGTTYTTKDTGFASGVSTGGVGSLDVTGDGVVYAEANSAGKPTVRFVPRSIDIASPVSFVLTNNGNLARVVTNGVYVVVAAGNYVECFDMDGTSRWVTDHGAQVKDVCLDGTRAYLCGALGTTNKHVRAMQLSASGAAVEIWSYRHSGTGGHTVDAIATNGQAVFFCGSTSSYGSGAKMRAVEAATGEDALNEGGTAASAEPWVWDAVPTAVPNQPGSLATDGRILVLGLDNSGGGGDVLVVAGCADGSPIGAVSQPDERVYSVSIDQEYIIVGMEDPTGGGPPSGSVTSYGHVMAYRKDSLALAWRWQATAGGVDGHGVRAVATDGAAVYVGLLDISNAGSIELARLNRGSTPTWFKRVDPTNNCLPMRQLAVPGWR